MCCEDVRGEEGKGEPRRDFHFKEVRCCMACVCDGCSREGLGILTLSEYNIKLEEKR